MPKSFEDKMKTMTGYCAGCGAEIMQLNLKRKKLMPNYRTVIFKLSNWTIMRIGIDNRCNALLKSGNKVMETAERILESHKIYWRANPKWAPQNFESLTVLDPNTNLSKFKREFAIKKHEENLNRSKK